MTGEEFGVTIFAMTAAVSGPARTPGGGSRASLAPERTMIQPEPPFLGRIKLPRKVAPDSRTMVSPGCAALRASCSWPPARTRRRRPADGR